MSFRNVSYPLSDSQKEAREKLVQTLLSDTRIQGFMKTYKCPEAVIVVNAYRFQTWLDDVLNVSKISDIEILNNPSLGDYIDLEYDLETHTLIEVKKRTREASRIISDEAYLNNYSIFPLNITLRAAHFATLSFDNATPRYLKAVDLAQVRCEDEHASNLFLYGALGVGKSFLAACITNSYAKKGKSVVFVSVMDLLSHLKSTFSVPYETERTLNALKYAKCLVLDDLGAESISSWGRDEVLLPILNYRMENKLLTIFTSNYSPDMLEDVYALDSRGNVDGLRAKRFVDRIVTLSECYEVTGENRRMAK